MFRAFHAVAAVGTVAGGIGVLLLGRWLRVRRPSRLVDVAVAFSGLGMVAWLIEVAVRLSVTVDRARHTWPASAHLVTSRPSATPRSSS